MSDVDENIEEAAGSPWISIVFASLIGTPILVYGVWCLYTGKAYVATRGTGLETFHGVAAYFIAASDISFAGMFFSVVIFRKLKNGFNIIVSGLLILTLILSAIGFFYDNVVKPKMPGYSQLGVSSIFQARVNTV